MVSTRFVHDYSMAKTRSRSWPKFFREKGGAIVLINKLNSPGTGFYRQLNGSPKLKSSSPKLKSSSPKLKSSVVKSNLKPKTKVSNAQITSKAKLSNSPQLKVGNSKDKISGKAGKSSSSLKEKVPKKVSTVTKLVRPCKLGNKVNCALHKSNTRKTNAGNKRGQTKNVEKKLSLKERVQSIIEHKNSESGKVTRSKSSNRASRSSTTKHATSVGTTSSSPNLSPVHTTPKHSTAQITRLNLSGSRLSPVTFKKQIRNLLQQAIARNQQRIEKTAETENIVKQTSEPKRRTRKLSLSNENEVNAAISNESEANAAISRTRQSLTGSKSSLPQTKSSLPQTKSSPPQTRLSLLAQAKSSLPNQTLTKQELIRASSIPNLVNLVISNEINVNVPNLDLSTIRSLTSSTTSTKKTKHSSSQPSANSVQMSTKSVLTESVRTRSKSLESVFTAGLRKEYNTRRSGNIPTTHLVKTSNHLNKQQNKRAQGCQSGGQTKTKNDKHHTPVPNKKTSKKSEQTDIPMTSAKKKEHTKIDKKSVVESPKREPGNQNSDFHEKMIDLMTTKFGRRSKSNKPKPNQKPTKHQKDLDEDERVGIVDEVTAVDSYVQARILSFKEQNESVGIKPGMLSSRKKTVISPQPTLKPTVVSSPKKTVTSQPILETNKQRRTNDGRSISTKKACDITKKPDKESDNARKMIDKITVTSKSTIIDIPNNISKKSVDKTNNTIKKSSEVNDSAKETIEKTNNVESVSPGSTSNEKSTADPIAPNIVSNDSIQINKNSHVDVIITEKTTKTTRTTLPLTLKSKIVILNGKKVKKKLSQNEKRIYNLLRCYGGSSTAAPSPVQRENMGENVTTSENNTVKKKNASSEITEKSPNTDHKKGVQSEPKKIIQPQLKHQEDDHLECRVQLEQFDSSKDKKCEGRESNSSGERRKVVQLTTRDEENNSRKQAKEKEIKDKPTKDKHTNGKDTKTAEKASTKKTVIQKDTREDCASEKTKKRTSGKSENYARDSSHQHDDKGTCANDSGSKHTGSKNTKISRLEKSISSPEYKEKRLQHKAKYNIIKEFKFSPSKVDNSYVNRKKSKQMRDRSSSEDDWTDEDEEKREGIVKKDKEKHARRKEDRKNQDEIGKKHAKERKNMSNNETNPISNPKRNNEKEKSFESKPKDKTKPKVKSKSESRRENAEYNKPKERPRLTYNSSGTDSSDNEFFEACNEDDALSNTDVYENVENKVANTEVSNITNKESNTRVNNNITVSDLNDSSDGSTDYQLLDKYKTKHVQNKQSTGQAQKQKKVKPIKRNSSSPDMNIAKTQKTDNSTIKTSKTHNSIKTQKTHVQNSSSTNGENIKTKNQKKYKKVLASKDYTSYIKNSEGKKHRTSVQALTNDLSPINVSRKNSSSPTNLAANSSNSFAQNSSNSFVEQLSDGIVHSDEDIFDDPIDQTPSTKQPMSSVNSSLNSSGNSGNNIKVTPPSDARRQNQTKSSSQVSEENKIEFKEIVNEHVNKYKTKDLVENLKQWTDMENEMREQRRSSSRSSKDKDVGNYRDYTTRRLAQIPVRILKKKKCEDLKKQMNNEYKNGRNGKDYFQCICFNKFFITRVRNRATGHFDILNVKVKPNKSENIVSISEVEFCTFCSRLYDKYKDNLILINQEYIINEFIQRHSNDWNKLNKSYDNNASLMSPGNLASSLCNCSIVSTATAKSGESHTGSRLDSISSDMTMGSDYSDYYLNEVFLKRARDVSKLASSHEFTRLRQKCRNVNLKINELCDLYKASPRRISSTETRSNMTDDTLDDGVFTRPTPRQGTSLLSDHSATLSNPRSLLEVSIKKSKTPCKSIASQTSPDEREDHYSTPRCYGQSQRYPYTPHTQQSEHYPCTPRRSRQHYPDSKRMDDGTLCPASATPNSFTCSRTPNSTHKSPRKKDHLFQMQIEKTKESFDRLFNKVWRKCSPAAPHHRKRGREYSDDDDCLNDSLRRSKKPRHLDLSSSRRSQVKRLNQSQLSTDFSNDEYDADFSDSDGNASSGDKVVEHRRHYVNKLFIKQSSSRQLFTNKKTSYSDSEQVVKIHNVKKKVYTTIQRKVYRRQDERKLNANHGENKRDLDKTNKQNRIRVNRTQKRSKLDRNSDDDIVDETPMNDDDSSIHSMDKTELKTIANNHKTSSYLQDKIQQIQYNNLWSKLTEKGDQSDSPSTRNMNQTPRTDINRGTKGDTDRSDIMIEMENEQGYKSTGISSTSIDNKTKKNNEINRNSSNLFEDTKDLSTAEGTRIMSPDTTNESLTIENIAHNISQIIKGYGICSTSNEDTNTSYNLMKEILVHKMNKLNTCEHIKDQVEKYANAVNQNIEPLNKAYVLKLLKKLMKCQEVCFEDYTNVLNKLKINLNINNTNQFLIKHGSSFTEQDELIMKQCYDKLYTRYHKKQSEVYLGLDISEDNVENDPKHNKKQSEEVYLGLDNSENHIGEPKHNKKRLEEVYLGLDNSEDHIGDPKHSTKPLVEDPVDSFETFKADLNRNEIEIDEKILDNDNIELEITSNNEIDVDEIISNNETDVNGMTLNNISENITITGNDSMNEVKLTIPLNIILS